MKNIQIFTVVALVILIISNAAFIGKVSVNNNGTSFGSVVLGNEYQPQMLSYATPSAGPTTLCSGPGTLGQVTITGAAAGLVEFYNATTSNVSLRTGNTATSSLILASVPASTAAGTYTFDAAATTGLIVQVATVRPTSTIMYRCN